MPVEPAGTSTGGASCTALVRVYRSQTGEVHALREIDADFPPASVTGVVGPSGSGKSSLLRILAGLDRPTAGRVVVDGTETSGLSWRGLRRLRRRSVGFVEQRPADNLLEHLTARQHLELAVATRVRDVVRSRGAEDGPDTLLALLGLTDRGDHRPAQLSGGEQQRLAIGRAIAGARPVLVADEPTAELDSDSGQAVLTLLGELADRGTTIVVSTHEDQAADACDRVIALRDGTVETVSGDEADLPARGGALAVIDGAGRVQLPPQALALFDRRRAVLRILDGEVRLRPPDTGGEAS